MIQFNLLPDVKIEYMKAQRAKRMLTSISLVAMAVALGLLLFSFFVVYVVQKASLRNVEAQIDESTSQLYSTPNLNKLLSVQNQLGALKALHEAKPLTTRAFEQLSSVTPENVSLKKMNIDYATNKLSIGGVAPSYDAVRVYVDTLKTTKYKIGDSGQPTPAFSGVVLSNFNKDDTGVVFAVDMSFSPALFDRNNDIKLQVVKGAKTNSDKLFDSEGVR